MTTPPRLLLDRLDFAGLIDLRTADNRLDSRINRTEAMALAIRGTIEGVGPRSGTIRYLRLLPASARAPAATTDRACASSSTAIARTNLGVYRQPLQQAVVVEDFGTRAIVSEGAVVGYCYAHCGLRAEGI